MLRWRLSLGLVFIASVFVLSTLEFWLPAHGYAPAGVILLPFSLLVALAGADEFAGLMTQGGHPVRRALVLGGTLAVIGSQFVPAWLAWQGRVDSLGTWGWPAMAFAATVLAGFGLEIRNYEKPGGVIARLGLSVFGVAYVALLWSFVIALRGTGYASARDAAWGMTAMLSLPIVVKLGDIGAYTVGRLIGKHKMAPVLSPGKTLEGAAGGLMFACAGSYVALSVLGSFLSGDSLPWWPRGWLVYGIAIGAAGMIGDLAESLLKRDVGAKDSSRWMPGFGGVLDLIDSVLFAAPVAWLLWKLGVVGP